MNHKSNAWATVLPVMAGFFIMGFVDMAGIATNYVKRDFELSDSVAGLVPMLAFLWFIVFSVPTGILLGKLGRKNTALLSLLITLAGLILPMLHYNFITVLAAFTLLGIGNTVSQISFNPLLSNVVAEQKLTSALTFGQFTRSIASFLGPIIAGGVAAYFNNWKLIFPVYALVTTVSLAWLYFAPIRHEATEQHPITFVSVYSLFRDKYILACFFGILFFIGIDVALNTYIPGFLIERTGLPLGQAGLGTSLYFAARMVGSFLGGFLFIRLSALKFLRWSMLAMVVAFLCMLAAYQLWMIGTLIVILGLTCANVFSVVLALALHHRPERANEVSAIVIMGVAGGALTTPVMGMIADRFNLTAALAVLLLCMVYILGFAFRLKN